MLNIENDVENSVQTGFSTLPQIEVELPENEDQNDNLVEEEIDNIVDNHQIIEENVSPDLTDYQLARNRERRTNIRPPSRLADTDFALILSAQSSIGSESDSYEEALNSKDSKHWLSAMKDEIGLSFKR
ncbi:hypothetical protein Adt_03015 [Abeliophyllum distichum]|uniref:Uncharacterized protein n=1 Tax=Abeliophyllum distichum TaxID=126358 RepID=A0ABD1VXB6_9LAMI